MLEGFKDRSPILLASFAQLAQAIGADSVDDFGEFAFQTSVDFLHRRPPGHQQVPDSNGQFAGQSGDNQFEVAFPGQ